MSDDEEQYNPKAHKNLLQAISSLGKIQHIRKSTRSEPQPQQDEFQLVKGATEVVANERGAVNAVGINDIVQILKTNKKHVATGKQLRNVQSSKKVLDKPLEKTVANRIKRQIGYEGVKKKLERWDAVVAKNRSADTQVFPLQTETVYVNTAAHARPLNTLLKSELALDLEAAEEKLKALKKARIGDVDDEKELEQREQNALKKKLSRDEMIARRKELAYLKMRESQKSAKARMQNKIKSKKYHKLQKRQKMLEQMKEFEILKKTNPEAALEKLNALEKTRVEERASLRHKNTGVWAKNLQVRAKYDKDVRKDLAEQLALSRQLTEKKDDESEEENVDMNDETAELKDQDQEYDPFNPWTKTKTNQNDQVSEDTENDPNWRKYWSERNENEKLLEEYRNEINKSMESDTEEIVDKPAVKKQKLAKSKTSKNVKKKVIENGWTVEEVVTKSEQNIDDIFDEHEDRIRNKLDKKLKQLSEKSERLKKKTAKTKKERTKKDALKNLKDLSFKNQVQRPDIDEELNYEKDENKDEAKTTTLNPPKGNNGTTGEPMSETIDPNKFAVLKLKQNLNVINSISDNLDEAELGEEDYDESTEQQLMISEAFEDDDIRADFSNDKSKDSELKNAEIQLSMPGWGSWAGAGIVDDGRKNKRLVLKLAPEEKRRDENKDGVFINEDTNKQLREHLVSDVPFPFTSLQDYEASIRAPIGRNVVPETAFRMLTRPAVITRKGQVIEPMDESELNKPNRRLRNVVDRRIQRAAAATSSSTIKAK